MSPKVTANSQPHRGKNGTTRHDYCESGFPAFRADLNDALPALASNSSGATAPSTTFANQFWYDTANNTLKQRNELNTDWLDIFEINQSTGVLNFLSPEIGGATATTQSSDNDSTKVATTAFVKSVGAVSYGLFRKANPDTVAWTKTGRWHSNNSDNSLCRGQWRASHNFQRHKHYYANFCRWH